MSNLKLFPTRYGNKRNTNKMSNIRRNKNERPFTAKRVVAPGTIMKPAPSVVKCEWKTINVKRLAIHEPTMEKIQNPLVCEDHPGCLGHLP